MSDIWTPENASAGDPRDAEVRSIAWNNFLLSDESYSGRWRTSAEVRITPETALQSTCVLAACRILAETIAGLPIHIYRRLENGERKVAEDIPLHKVLTFAPNAWQTKYEFFEQMVMNITLWGNNYSLVRSGKYGSVSELLNLHPSRMDVERLENGRLRYNYTDPETGKYERYSQDEVMHVRWTPEPDGIKGIVPIEIAREAIALARACEIHASKYWANSARPGIVLTTDGTLSAEAAEKLRENWERLHRGVDRAYKTAILTGGLKPEQIGFTAEQSQFIDSRRFQCEEIARVYRLPLHLIQGTSGGNLEIQGQEFVTYTLMPWLKRIESAISRSLIWNDDLFFAEFDVRGLLRADSNSRATYYSTMMSLGILSVNEIRKLENLQPLGEEGDKHFIAMNVQPLEDAGKQKQDPMAAMMGAATGGAPPPKEKGVPSLPGAKTGEAPLEMPKGEGSEKKPEKEEKRDCGRDSGGKFGPKNKCAADDGQGGGEEPPSPSWAQNIEHSMKKSRGYDDPANKQAWLNLSGTFYPVRGDHGEFAANHGVEGGGEDLLDAGWLRVAGIGAGTLYVGNSSGKPPKRSQISALRDFAISTGTVSQVVFDDGRSRRGKVLWSKDESRSADCGRDSGGRFGSKNTCAADDGGSNISGGSAPKKGKGLLASLPKTIEAGSDLLKKYVPFTPVSRKSNKQFSRPPSDEKAKAALNKSQQEKYGAHREKPEGYPMSLRIDINAFENKDTYVVTAHEKVDGLTVGTVLGYDNVVRLNGPVTFKSKEDNATLVATGSAKKSPIATVTGGLSKSKDVPLDIDSWTPVGYDPKKAAYFYDKTTGQEVTGGTDSISIGNSVFVRKPTHGKRKAQVQYRAANFWGTETRELPDQTAAYYDTMTAKAEQSGKFSHEAVAYTDNAPAEKACAGCLFFDAGECEVVSSPISPLGSCRLYESGGDSESRDCGRDDGGQFGADNKCQTSNSTGEPIRGVRKGRDRRQTNVARKIYQMGSSEKQVKSLIRELGGKVRNSRVEIDSTRGDEGVNIFVRDADLNESHVIHVGYYGATVYPTDPLTEEEASQIESAMREAMPKTISDRLYGGGKEYPIEVLREPTDFDRPPESSKKSFKDKYNQRDCGTGAGGFKPGNDCASGRGDEVAFPKGSSKYRSAIDSVVSSTGIDATKIWDRSKGLVSLPERNEIKKIADEQASHSGKPMDAAAKKAYGSLVDEIGRQYQALLDSGLKVKAWKGDGEPYGDPPGSAKPNSDKMRQEIAKTGEYSFFMTEKGFGSGEATADHPMLQETKFKTSEGEPMIANDLFRVVHDFVAHVRGGHSFSTRGEYNGMLTHASTLPDSAWPALFAETFGQNATYELTGGYATQNAYASRDGAELIRTELQRSKRSAGEERDSDEPLGYQHIKSRPWLATELDKIEARNCDSSDKNDSGQFTTGNDCAAGDGDGSDKSQSDGTQSQSSGEKIDVASIIRKIAENPDGFTIHPYTQGSPSDGIMVSEFSNSDAKRSLQLSDSEMAAVSTKEKLRSWLDSNKDAIRGRDDRFIGGWKDGDKFFLDISTRFPPEKAKQALDAGRKAGQLAVFNLKNFKTTWVKFDDGDPNKPDDWDKGFARARKDAAVSQAYDDDTPPMDEEDWAAELSKHGKTTVRSLLQHLCNTGYNFEARAIEGLLRRAERNERHEQTGAGRHPDRRDADWSVPSIPGHDRGQREGEGSGTRSGVVQGRAGGYAGTVRGGLEEAESRQDCGRDSNGRFSIDNDCATLDKDFTESVSKNSLSKIVEYTAEELKSGIFSGAEKLDSLTVRSPRGEKPQKILRSLGVSSFSDLLKIGAALTRGGHVEASFTEEEVAINASFPIDKDADNTEDSWEGYAHVETEISREPDGKIGVHWGDFIFEDSLDSITEKERHRISSLLSEAALDAADAAEKSGVAQISTLAAGSGRDDTYKGYRLWPQFGFDGPVTHMHRTKIPESILKTLPDRNDFTVQELIATPEGKKWWNKNGGTTYMKLDFSDKNSLGYKKFKKKLSLLDRLRGRNQDRSHFPELVEYRDDCGNDGNTGRFTKGNDCAAGSGGATKEKLKKTREKTPKQKGPKGTPAKLNWSPGSSLPNHVQEAIDDQPTKRSADGSQIVSTPIADEKDIYNFAAKDFVSTVKVGEHLAAKQAESRGERIDTGKDGGLHPEEEAYMVESLAQQAKQAMDRGIEPKFYSPEERSAQIEEFSKLIPQVKGGRTKSGVLIEQEDAEHLFRAVQAMTSPNASPFSNMQRTDQLLNKFFNNDADLRTSETLGVTGPGIRKSLGRYMAVIERLGKKTSGGVDIAEGLKKTRELFTGKVLSPNDAKDLFEELLPGSGEEYKPSNYQVDTKVPLFSTFGPKVGPFFANNNGETDHLTADIWWTRTWGRNSGELVVPPSPTKGAEKAKELLKVAGRAKREQLHGVDGQSLVSSLKEMTKSGIPDDIVRQWAGERLRHYARGDYKEKTGVGGTLNKLAKNIVENDWHLMRDPGGGRRRSAMIGVAQKAASKVGLPPAYMQDVLWQDEQDAYAALGAKTITSQGELSLYSDVIRRIATEEDARKPMAERVGVKPKRPKKSKRTAGGDPLVEAPYDDYDKGGREQMLFDAATHELSDEQFVDILLKYAAKATDYESSSESRSMDCGRADGGKFGPKNTCAADDGGSNISSGSAGSASWGSDAGTEVHTASKPLFKGAENIGEIRINRSREVKEILGDAVKLSLPEILDATGVPANKAKTGVISKPTVTINPGGGKVSVIWESKGRSTGEGFAPHEKPFAKSVGKTVVAAQARRLITPSDAGPKLYLSSMFVHPDFQRQGIASEAVIRATSAPLAELKMNAARADEPDPHVRMVGYAVWPKFGYNATMNSAWRAIDSQSEIRAMESGGDLDLAAAIVQEAEDNYNALVDANGGKKPVDLLQLFSMNGGQDWWKEYGGDITLHFDRRPRSPSRETLMRYMDSRKRRRRAESKFTQGERAADWDITNEDEEVLDQVWREIIDRGPQERTPEDLNFLKQAEETDGGSEEVRED